MADDAAAPEGELSEASSEDGTEAGNSTSEGESEAKAADETDAADEPDVEDGTGAEQAPAKPRMSHVRLATILGLVAVVALAGLCGWLGYRAYESRKAADERNLFLQVGRQGALNLTTIDFEHADQDVQRILDSATGQFYDEFQARAQPFAEVVKQAKSKSVGTVSAPASSRYPTTGRTYSSP